MEGDSLEKNSIIPVLHNTQSSQRLAEVARTVYGLGFNYLIVTKAVGSAAQVGVPEAQKLAYKFGRNLLVLADLSEAIELLQPRKVLLVMPGKYGGRGLHEALAEAAKELREGDKVFLVFGGVEPGLSQRELKLGEMVSPEGVEEDIGTVALVAISLYRVNELLRRQP
ncbi:RecB-family nuclease [Infirmifilum uzonense]|uniref:RecB-family nuclease n=1 Tax=Infirmifilum uzonense TaxID=1550241 RepID=UPI00069CA6E0